MDIKSCPFCKSPETVLSSVARGERILCTSCFACGPVVPRDGHLDADLAEASSRATRAWNETRERGEAAEQRVREVEALVPEWRNESKCRIYHSERRAGYSGCADELEAALQGTGSGSAGE